VVPFRHNDVERLRALFGQHRSRHRRALVLTDGVFSMDGDLAPLAALGRLAADFDAWLMADDAYGIGVVGDGRGSTFAAATPADVPLQMGTLSKAMGAYGGYLCASAPVIKFIKNRARTLVYSTALPPAIVAAAYRGARHYRRRPRIDGHAARPGESLHPPRRAPRGGEPDRPGDRRDSRARAGGGPYA
jgi:8-amino-7-oxononanoate synthase